MLNSIEDTKRQREFLERLSMDVSAIMVYNSNVCDSLQSSYSICGKTFTTLEGLKKICFDEIEKFSNNRQELIDQLSKFYNEFDRKLVNDAASCHLRADFNHKRKASKCDLCKCDIAFHAYSKCLFSRSDEILKFTGETIGNQSDDEGDDDDDDDENEEKDESHDVNELLNDENMLENLRKDKLNAVERKMYRSLSDLENFFKVLCLFFKHDEKLQQIVKIGKQMLEMYAIYKDEFKLCRQFFISVSHQINSFDEMEMAKIKIRLREPGEPLNHKHLFIIERNQIQTQLMKNLSEKKCAEIDLRKKLGQLLYLQNLLKVRMII